MAASTGSRGSEPPSTSTPAEMRFDCFPSELGDRCSPALCLVAQASVEVLQAASLWSDSCMPAYRTPAANSTLHIGLTSGGRCRSTKRPSLSNSLWASTTSSRFPSGADSTSPLPHYQPDARDSRRCARNASSSSSDSKTSAASQAMDDHVSGVWTIMQGVLGRSCEWSLDDHARSVGTII